MAMRATRPRRSGPMLRAQQMLEYAALRTVAGLMRALPVDTASALMGWVWEKAAPLTRRHARVMENLAIAFPDAGPEARLRIARAQWNNLGRTFAETFQIDRIAADPSRIVSVYPAAIHERLRACETGAIFVSMHAANWEVAALPVRAYFPVAGLYQRLSNPLSDRYVTGMRGEVFNGGLFSKGHRTAAQVMRWVREGKAIGILVDHREARGVPVTFFGRETTANPFPAMVARRLHVPLYAARAMRDGGARFRVDGVEIPVPVTGDPAADVQVATQAIQSQFEAWIRERPEEWMWVHDRWRDSGRRRIETPAPSAVESAARGSG
ncbi:LpxL/LpxP family acyltransferase [Faunimonas sp. B44]